ncbi:NAD-dependent epimerase/dehydratase family protein [Candidatus Woesearchaeota archaeon]|nr:NAD-dependent epimerase/dehydratase family protein [Candidatus Woesearchaeota archaeon]
MKSTIIQEDVAQIISGIGESVHKLSGKTLLITGGAGFLGNYFLDVIQCLNETILEKPCKMISVDNFLTGLSYRIPNSEHFTRIKHNIKEPLAINEKIDYIVHAAGIASPKFYRQYKIETIDVATLGTKNMLELANEKKVKSIVFFSSSEVYGDPDPKHVPTSETYPGNVLCTGPRANYDESKRLGETLCVAYYETYTVPVKMIRPFNVYGPGMRSDDYRVIPNFVVSIQKGKDIPVYGTGNHTRTFCYISDAMTGFFKVLLSDENGEPFNIGAESEEVTIEDLALTIAGIFKREVRVVHQTGPNDAYGTADPRRRCPNLTKSKTRLGYMSKVGLSEGITRYVKWVRETSTEDISLLELKEP